MRVRHLLPTAALIGALFYGGTALAALDGVPSGAAARVPDTTSGMTAGSASSGAAGEHVSSAPCVQDAATEVPGPDTDAPSSPVSGTQVSFTLVAPDTGQRNC